MDILLVAATELEMQPLLGQLGSQSFPHNGHVVTTLITGVGQVAVTWSLMKALEQSPKPDMLVQVGIGGLFGNGHTLGEAVAVAQDCFGDLGMEEKGHFSTVFEKGFASLNEPPFTNGWLLNNSKLLNRLPLAKVKGVTVNKISDSEPQTAQLIQTFDPVVESMEGAAFHYVCLRAGLPFVQIRGLSNQVGQRDKAQWEIGAAVGHSCEAVTQLVNSV